MELCPQANIQRTTSDGQRAPAGGALLWGALVVIGVGIVLWLAPSRWGWGAAVIFSVVATPRLLVYMFMTFLAALTTPNTHSRP